jgi:hypothetical protein
VFIAAGLAALRSTPEFAHLRVPPSETSFGLTAPPAAAFAPVPGAAGLYALHLPWRLSPWHVAPMSVHAVALGGGRWAVVDTGAPNSWLQRHAAAVADAVAALMGADGTLSLVLRARPARASPAPPLRPHRRRRAFPSPSRPSPPML